MLTALGDRESRLKGWQERADEYLTKPFDIEELKIRLINLLDIRDILKKRFGELVFQPALAKNVQEIPEKNSKKQLQLEFIEGLDKNIESIYTEPSLKIATIASSMAMSERQLFRKIKAVTDLTPSEYLRRFRLEKAKRLIKEGNSISNSAFDVGFVSVSYFSKCFRAQFGYSPSEFM